MYQSIRITPYKAVYCIRDNEEYDEYIMYADTQDELLNRVSKMIAMNDCCPIEFISIECNEREVRYVGWRPGMEFTYEWADTQEEFWTGYYPELDH